MAIKINTVTRQLPCKLSDEEAQIAGSELASLIEAKAAEEERQKEIKTALKGELEKFNNDIRILAAKVSRREVIKSVEVEIHLIPNSMLVKEVRTDTGEIVKERKAADNELQSGFGG